MESARDRAEEWLLNNIGVADRDTIDGLELLLKEQDKISREYQHEITRNVCAQAIIQTSVERGYVIKDGETGEEVPALLESHAYNTCMNVKAV